MATDTEPLRPPLPLRTRIEFGLLFISVLISALGLLSMLICLLMLVITSQVVWLSWALGAAGAWIGFGLLNATIMGSDGA